MINKAIQPTEHQIQQMLINYLKLKGWYVMRLNSGKYSVGEGRSRRFVIGQDAGTPDIMAFKPLGRFRVVALNKEPKIITTEKSHTQLIFIEVKRTGNKPTALQTAKMQELEEYGAKCLVIHSLEELQAEGF